MNKCVVCGRDAVVSSAKSWVQLSKVTSFLGFLETINRGGMLRLPPRLIGLTVAGTLKWPPPLMD